MEDTALWKEIAEVVESGDEIETIDLKQSSYNLDSNDEKGNFAKDVSAIANSLEKGKTGYLVIGVRDKNNCARPCSSEDYLIDIQIGDLNRFRQRHNNILKDYIYPKPSIKYLPYHHNESNRNILIILVEAWDEVDPRPYIIKRDIGKIKEGQIFYRDASDNRVADLNKIRSLVAKKERSENRQRTKRLKEEIKEFSKRLSNLHKIIKKEEKKHQKQVNKIIEDYSEKIKKQEDYYTPLIKRLNDENENLKNDYKKEKYWLDEQNEELEKENQRLLNEEREARFFINAIVKEFYRTLPEDKRDEIMDRFLKIHKMEKYSTIIKPKETNNN